MRCANASQPPACDFVRVDDDDSQIPVWPTGYCSQAGKAKFPSISAPHNFGISDYCLDFFKVWLHFRVLTENMPVPLRLYQPHLIAVPVQHREYQAVGAHREGVFRLRQRSSRARFLP